MIAIDKQIDKVYTVSGNVNETFEEKVNSYFDDILIVKKDIVELTQLMGQVVDAFYEDHVAVEILKESLPKIKIIVKAVTLYSNKLVKSKLYRRIKLEYRNLKWAIGNFKEMANDIEFMYFSNSRENENLILSELEKNKLNYKLKK